MTMSRSPSSSKSSMIAPPDWLNRSSPASWLLSRNCADVELGVEETIDGAVKPRITLFRRFTEGHMSDFQKPADADVIREELEVFAKMLNGESRSCWIRMHGSG